MNATAETLGNNEILHLLLDNLNSTTPSNFISKTDIQVSVPVLDSSLNSEQKQPPSDLPPLPPLPDSQTQPISPPPWAITRSGLIVIFSAIGLLIFFIYIKNNQKQQVKLREIKIMDRKNTNTSQSNQPHISRKFNRNNSVCDFNPYTIVIENQADMDFLKQPKKSMRQKSSNSSMHGKNHVPNVTVNSASEHSSYISSQMTRSRNNSTKSSPSLSMKSASASRASSIKNRQNSSTSNELVFSRISIKRNKQGSKRTKGLGRRESNYSQTVGAHNPFFSSEQSNEYKQNLAKSSVRHKSSEDRKNNGDKNKNYNKLAAFQHNKGSTSSHQNDADDNVIYSYVNDVQKNGKPRVHNLRILEPLFKQFGTIF